LSNNPFENIDKYLILTGPTASGKSSIAEYLTNLYSLEIISADSRQIYRGMDIGTAKPAKGNNVQYHLIDICEISERYNAGTFLDDCDLAIKEILDHGKIPIIVGGTGFYIRTLTEGIMIGELRSDKIRNELLLRDKNNENLYTELQRIDPIAAKKIHPNNTVRTIRALEVYYYTGKPISWHWKNRKYRKSTYEYIKVAINHPREILRNRIRQRTVEMIDSGWIEEVQALLSNGYTTDMPGFNSVGYREIARYLSGKIDRDSLIDEIFHLTWQYSRRQMVWLRKEPNLRWIELTGEENVESIAENLLDIISQ
jgi:tRNA dimethylallyltransferase